MKKNTFWGKSEKDVLMEEILNDPIYKENMTNSEVLKNTWKISDMNRNSMTK